MKLANVFWEAQMRGNTHRLMGILRDFPEAGQRTPY
jgi:hypothetical protein